MIAEFPFGPWLPDQNDYKNPGLEVCTNMLPSPDGYQPARGFGEEIADLGAAALSARVFERADGTRVTVAASATDLHTIINGTVADSSLSLTLTAPVAFERFGQSIYATNKTGFWYLDDIEADDTFAVVSGTVPAARTMARVSDFLVMGDLTDIDTSDAPYRVRWSQFNNPQGDWTDDIGVQAGAVDMPEHLGRVMAITGGTAGLVFQRNGLSRLFYTGGGTVFGKQIVDEARGCQSSRSVVQVGAVTYYLADDGFAVSDGAGSQTISSGRVWRWFLANAGQAYIGSVEGAVDWQNRCVAWTVPDNSGVFTGLLFYCWENQQWSYVELALDTLVATGQDGLSLEQVSALYPNLDTMPGSLDDAQFMPRQRFLGAFTGGSYATLGGETLAANFATGDFQPQPGFRVFARSVTPLIEVETGDMTVSLSGKATPSGGLSASPEVLLGPLGFAAFNFDARFARVRMTLPAGSSWSNAYGFQVDFSVTGQH